MKITKKPKSPFSINPPYFINNSYKQLKESSAENPRKRERQFTNSKNGFSKVSFLFLIIS